MKTIAMSLSAALLTIAAVTNADAVTCANGVYRAGCAGPNGAVVARKPVAVAPAPKAVVVAPAPRAVVVAPAAGCRYVNGVRVCR
jgi:hypothetical protein